MPSELATRAQPLPSDWSVLQARDHYLRENGFTLAGYDAAWTRGSLFGIPFVVPNTQRHRWAIKLHDLHHVATGYGTDLIGEVEISAWELRRGFGKLGLYVGSIVLSLAMTGFLIAPRRTLRAWQASGRGHTSLFSDVHGSYDELLHISVGELRGKLAVPLGGVAEHPRGSSSAAPRTTPPLAG
jgi:hypothetical protein